MTVFVDFKKLHPYADTPRAMSDGACGFDLTATSYNVSAEYVEYGTGIAIQLPQGYVGILAPRSSVTKTGWMLGNSIGVIDIDFTGEIKFRFYKNTGIMKPARPYEVGDRVGQILIVPCPVVKFTEVENLMATKRSNGGFGSTGK